MENTDCALAIYNHCTEEFTLEQERAIIYYNIGYSGGGESKNHL